MRDLKNPKLLYAKGFLFLLAALLAGALLVLQNPRLQTAALLAIAVWCFARFYYFAFYVIERYVDPAYRFAGLWSERTGAPVKVAMRERAFRLSHVTTPRRVPGRMRAARAADRELLFQWLSEFTDEALVGHLPADIGEVADRWVAGINRTMQLWIDHGIPVSMAGVGSPTPHGIRIGPVYTPRDLRDRGYASNLVAAACSAAIREGRRFCFLFTDLSNPTSNHIYQAIGFEPVSDVDRWSFGPRSPEA